jgi:hypothetical protein
MKIKYPKRDAILALLVLVSILLLGQAVGCSDEGSSQAGGSQAHQQSQQEAGWVETPVKSSVFSRLAYDYESGTARAFFKTNSVYDYYNVPEDVYEGWRDAYSPGRHFHTHIRGKYRYKRQGR